EDAVDGGLAEPELVQEGLLLGPRDPGHLALDDGRHPPEPRAWALRNSLEAEAGGERDPLAEILLVQVQAVEDRLLGEEREAANRFRVLVGEGDGAERRRPLATPHEAHA